MRERFGDIVEVGQFQVNVSIDETGNEDCLVTKLLNARVLLENLFPPPYIDYATTGYNQTAIMNNRLVDWDNPCRGDYFLGLNFHDTSFCPKDAGA
jgi:hypothetical protein